RVDVEVVRPPVAVLFGSETVASIQALPTDEVTLGVRVGSWTANNGPSVPMTDPCRLAPGNPSSLSTLTLTALAGGPRGLAGHRLLEAVVEALVGSTSGGSGLLMRVSA